MWIVATSALFLYPCSRSHLSMPSNTTPVACGVASTPSHSRYGVALIPLAFAVQHHLPVSHLRRPPPRARIDALRVTFASTSGSTGDRCKRWKPRPTLRAYGNGSPTREMAVAVVAGRKERGVCGGGGGVKCWCVRAEFSFSVWPKAEKRPADGQRERTRQASGGAMAAATQSAATPPSYSRLERSRRAASSMMVWTWLHVSV